MSEFTDNQAIDYLLERMAECNSMLRVEAFNVYLTSLAVHIGCTEDEAYDIFMHSIVDDREAM